MIRLLALRYFYLLVVVAEAVRGLQRPAMVVAAVEQVVIRSLSAGRQEPLPHQLVAEHRVLGMEAHQARRSHN